jgi:undecaprenyl-diphosphatase
VLVLGAFVVRSGEPSFLLPFERAVINHGTLIAWWITWSCYAYALAPICLVLIVVAWRYPAWRGRVAFSIAVLLVCWVGNDLLQHAFHRVRSLSWVVKHETAYSYPSSHAAIAVGFFGLWSYLVRRSSLPKRTALVVPALLVALVVAVCWSRLALGAHYLTDLVGGVLLAAAVVFAGAAAIRR